MKIYAEKSVVVRNVDLLSNAKQVFGYSKKISKKGHEVVSYDKRGLVELVEFILRTFYDVEQITDKKEVEDASKVTIWDLNDTLCGCLLVHKLSNEIKDNLDKAYSFTELRSEMNNLSDEEFKNKYRSTKEEIDEEFGVLFFIGNDDYVIVSGDEYKDLDEVLTELEYQVLVS